VVNKAIEDAINQQLNAELVSAYLYLSMSAHFESERLPGFAHWMRLQGREELGHAMQFFDHLVDRGGRVSLAALDQPPSQFSSPLAIFEQALQHEQRITASIHSLYDLVTKEGDHASQPLLLSFISEQIEEEKTAGQIVDQLRMVGEQRGPLLFIDRHLGKRSE
jgi:ferritin